MAVADKEGRHPRPGAPPGGAPVLGAYAAYSLVRVENPGRGHCGYMRPKEDHLVVRKKVTAEMRAHPERYAPFIAGCMISIKRAAESELDAELINEEAYEKDHVEPQYKEIDNKMWAALRAVYPDT